MEIIIKPKKSFSIDFKELWYFREIFYSLALRDIKVRYKQTVIGILWAILQPFLMMVVFSVFFGKLAGISSGDVPYPIFAFAGLIFWNYFSSSLSSASNSLVSNQAIIQKIYFPRLIVPISSTAVYLLDFVLSLIIFAGLLIYYKFTPSFIGVLIILPALLISFLASNGLGLFLASVNVKYRDVRYALPFFIQMLLFVTPVIYPSNVLGKYQWLWYLNPMSGVIEAIRGGFLGGIINWQLFGASLLVSIGLFIIGAIYFNKTEKYFADVI